MDLATATSTLLMRTQQESAQPSRPKFTTENFNAWLQLNTAVHEKVAKWNVEIMRISNDTKLTQEGKHKTLAGLGEQIAQDVGPPVAAPLREATAALTRLRHLMLDPITAKPKGDPMVTIMREQELRRTIPKHEANAVYLRALERDDLETARAILDAPGAPWVSDEVRRRGEDAYAERTNPKAWETVQSLEYLHAHLDSLAGQTRTWFVALGASKESIQKTIGG